MGYSFNQAMMLQILKKSKSGVLVKLLFKSHIYRKRVCFFLQGETAKKKKKKKLRPIPLQDVNMTYRHSPFHQNHQGSLPVHHTSKL